MKIITNSISKNLTIALIITVVIVSGMMFILNYYYVSVQNTKNFEKKATEYMDFFSESIKTALWNIDIHSIKQMTLFSLQNDFIAKIKICDPLGKNIIDFSKPDIKKTGIHQVRQLYWKADHLATIECDFSFDYEKQLNKQFLIFSTVIVIVIILTLVVITGQLLQTFLKKPFNHLNGILMTYPPSLDTQIPEITPQPLEFQPLIRKFINMGDRIKDQINAINQANETYRSIFENAIEGIFRCSEDGKFISVNPAFLDIFGYSSQGEFLDRNFNIAVGFLENNEKQALFTKNINNACYVNNFEAQVVRKDNVKIWIMLHARVIVTEVSQIKYIEGSLIDITKRKKAEEYIKNYNDELERLIQERTTELIKSNQRLSDSIKEQQEQTRNILRLNHMSDLLHACETEEQCNKVVASCCRQIFNNDAGYILIYSGETYSLHLVVSWGKIFVKETIASNTCGIILNNKPIFIENPKIQKICEYAGHSIENGYMCAPIVSQKDVIGVMHLRFGDDKKAYTLDAYQRLIESKQLILTRIVENYALSISNLRLREKLRLEGIIDPLTKLYNRRYMEKCLEREIKRSERHDIPLSVIMVDIDHFKQVNDTYGHEAGDMVLREMSLYLKNGVRLEDIACRYGGEEFTLILPESTPFNAGRRAEQLRIRIKNELQVNYKGHLIKITASFGVAGLPDNLSFSPDLIGAADLALYRAKHEGRDKVVLATADVGGENL